MTHAATEPKTPRARLIVIIVMALVGIGLITFAVLRGTQTTATPSASPTSTVSTVAASSPEATGSASAPAPGSTAATSASSPAASVTSAAAGGCSTASEGFVPNRFTIDSLGADEAVVALGQDAEGNIAAPPLDEPRMASWWNEGPRPGSDKGKAVLSIHTYRTGSALGNEMYADGASALEPGDLIKLYGPDGVVQCYEFTEAKKIWVKDYDPNSDVMVDFEGDPMLTIIICWDFDRKTEIWESRVFFYGKPVA